MTPPAFGLGLLYKLAAPRPVAGSSHNKWRKLRRHCADYDTNSSRTAVCRDFEVPEPYSHKIQFALYIVIFIFTSKNKKRCDWWRCLIFFPHGHAKLRIYHYGYQGS